MRLSLLVLLLVGVALVVGQGQRDDRRERARARFLELASKARSGDKAAQQELQARRRIRTRQRTQTVSESPAATPQRSVFPTAQPASLRPEPVPTPVFRESRPAPRPVQTVRSRVPVRRKQIRVSQRRLVTPQPTTFRPPTVFPIRPAVVPVFHETEVPVIEETVPVTEPPVSEIFPTEPVPQEPTPVLESEPVPFVDAPLFDIQPEEQIHVFAEPEKPRASVQRVQRPRPATEVTKPSTNIIRRPQETQRSRFDFELEPHRALNEGLEVDSRSEHIISRAFNAERTTKPPVETIRRYSYFDEEGSYIFGYEAADGSFKEEKRGRDCIVTGKYGYVDPDGVRREFTYTSGNQCDPNAVVDPDNQEVPPLPLNDQFLEQTMERQLTQEELNQISFNRRRQPAAKKPVVDLRQPLQQNFITSSRRQPQQTRSRPVVQTRQRQPQPQQEPQQSFSPIPVTPAPAPLFTTPATFNRFTTPVSLRRPQPLPRQNPVQEPTELFTEEVRVTTPPPVVVTPTQAQVLSIPTSPRLQPRPLPKPVTFDFNAEFQNLFNHFAIPTTRRPFFQTPTQVITRPTTPASTRPPPPPPSPTPRPTFPPRPTSPPLPVTNAPLAFQSPSNFGSGTIGAPQLVFDAHSRTFKTVHTPVRSSPTPRPFQSPFVTSAPPSNPGHPLPLLTRQGAGVKPGIVANPLPPVPTGGLVISSAGRSVATDEFDKFFSKFNLKF
ncbi:hypothetical protein Pmani_013837 [Petrolisthes manimaculis]|uniref:Uncharacterized protein n=1 Tax=Petrolisthes manimaculis TaxID=1843537 RepID=A0AAE1PU38_9EUCA|nr:hypothetical protein Pmani_013837 [Petrolisthes manimaculis]